MSVPSREEREELLTAAESDALRREFADSARACEAWDRAHPTSLAGVLSWIDQLRAAFGDPPVDREPTRGDDFRI